ncbi:UNVERIFIED_CONTAM: O-fucosyltransferase 11 [Sesamum calycinum]|uniref:O-fucosyltransferase family protein n=1 Tax=Sesamum calycinum TaxID=2727403 RepID=A0AAW2P8T4_9LAMI
MQTLNPSCMASTYTSEPTTNSCRRRLHLHCKHRRRGVFCFFFTGIFHERYLIFLTILYIMGLVTCAGPLLTILHPPPPPLPGSLYRSQELFLKLWPEIQSDNASTVELDNLWRYRRKLKEQRPCLNATAHWQPVSPGLQRYLVVEANGGLNQQRSSICNAVAVAGLLNATLVIPRFDLHNVWKDPSEFADIYDEDHFISSLKGFVMVVRDLPDELMESYNSSISNIPSLRVQAWASVRYYLDEVYPILQEQVNRMTDKSFHSGGKYVSVHLRFEEDMVAFSCCMYDGGEKEKAEMDAIREKGWGKKFMRENRIIEPGLNRVNGRCPMTPVEGFSSRLAALDYMVCLSSEVFVTTQGGNFPHFLMGHRRFLYNGHAKTIMPDKTKLAVLLQNTSISWDTFKDEMESMLAESDRKSIMVPRVKKSTRKGSVYLNPLPECRSTTHDKLLCKRTLETGLSPSGWEKALEVGGALVLLSGESDVHVSEPAQDSRDVGVDEHDHDEKSFMMRGHLIRVR